MEEPQRQPASPERLAAAQELADFVRQAHAIVAQALPKALRPQA